MLALLFLAGCSDKKKFFEDERYKKMVYIVSGNNNVHNLVYDLGGKDGNIRNLSTTCSGTNPTGEPVTIPLTEDAVLLDEYSYTNLIEDYSQHALKMGPKDYAIESSTVTYPTGEPCTLVSIEIDISVIGSLDPNKIYFAPIVVVGATPHPIVKKKGNALLQIQKKNKYTSFAEPANYNALGYRGSGCFVITETMVPLTRDRVGINIGTERLPAEPENQPGFTKKNAIVIETANDNSLAVESYDPEEMEVETVDVRAAYPGDNTYALYNNRSDPTTTISYVCYKYRLKTGSQTEIREATHSPVTVIE